MYNIELSDIVALALVLTLLRTAYMGLRVIFFTSKIKYLEKKEHAQSLKEARESLELALGSQENKVEVLQVEPVFTMSTVSDEIKEKTYQLEEAQAVTSVQEKFVMPTTDKEWKKYEEPTYLRRGLFLS